ncbi:MAG: DUF72 domain-containing protein [Bacteroidota bacterium]
MSRWRIGCSGYQYAEWRGIFYPESLPQRKWLEHYCEHFDSLELNVTFYRFPKLEFLQSCYDRSPAHFTFSVKAPRLITHYKRLSDAQGMLSDFCEAVHSGLREKLGCVLFQFPATFIFEDDRLEKLITLLKGDCNVVEFRHDSWWQEKVYRALGDHNITFCSMSHPRLPDEVIRTTPTLYYRFHGVPHLYHSAYDPAKLKEIIKKIEDTENVEKAHVYFNNTAEGNAICNAKQLKVLTEGRKSEVQRMRG